jgi:hypothetical protein
MKFKTMDNKQDYVRVEIYVAQDPWEDSTMACVDVYLPDDHNALDPITLAYIEDGKLKIRKMRSDTKDATRLAEAGFHLEEEMLDERDWDNDDEEVYVEVPHVWVKVEWEGMEEE